MHFREAAGNDEATGGSGILLGMVPRVAPVAPVGMKTMICQLNCSGPFGCVRACCACAYAHAIITAAPDDGRLGDI